MGTKPWQNSEGYSDPTAYEGLKPVIREDEEQQRRLNNLIFRSEVHYPLGRV